MLRYTIGKGILLQHKSDIENENLVIVFKPWLIALIWTNLFNLNISNSSGNAYPF